MKSEYNEQDNNTAIRKKFLVKPSNEYLEVKYLILRNYIHFDLLIFSKNKKFKLWNPHPKNGRGEIYNILSLKTRIQGREGSYFHPCQNTMSIRWNVLITSKENLAKLRKHLAWSTLRLACPEQTKDHPTPT